MIIKINGHTVKGQVLPVDKPTLDETLESLDFCLVSNTTPMPYAPCQKVELITDDLETISFFLVSDNVEIFSINPLRYKHTLTCVQNTRKLSKHLVRNSVFSTPSYLTKESYTGCSISLSNRTKDDADPNFSLSERGNYRAHRLTTINAGAKDAELDPINTLGARERVKTAYFELDCQAVKCPAGQVGTELPGTSPSEWVNNLNNKLELQTQVSLSSSNLVPIYSYLSIF